MTETSATLEALRNSERNFRHMAENVPGALFQYVQRADGSSHVLYMSPQCEDLWEVPSGLIERDASVLWQMVHPEDLPGMAASVAESARTLAPWYWEWRITTPSGKRKWLQGSGRPIAQDDGTFKWNSFILDVTDRRLAEDEQRVLRAALRQAQQLESLGRLAGGVAHDINNVLTVILGFGESAMMSLPEDASARDDIAEVLSAAMRSAAMTRQLLVFARQQTAAPVTIDTAERLEDGSLMLQRLVGESITIDYALDADVPPIDIDPGQLDQVVTNLVINARDAMPNGGRVTIGLRYVDRMVELSVSDAGVGMDATTRAQMYEPFYSTKSVQHGTGLGLSTVYSIVSQQGGFIEVDSELGRGTVFRVRFKASAATVTTKEGASETTRPTMLQRIVVCEDDAQVRRLVHRVLVRHGCTVWSTDDPDVARTLAAHHRPDLLLTDVVTGGMGGVRLAAAIREDQPALPVVFMTGYVADELTRQILQLGRDFVLRKPFRTAELLNAMDNAMVAGAG